MAFGKSTGPRSRNSVIAWTWLLNALPLKSLQRPFAVSMNAADLSNLQKICACDEERVDGFVCLFRPDRPNGESRLFVLSSDASCRGSPFDGGR